MRAKIAISKARVFDSVAGTLSPAATVLIDGDTITDVVIGPTPSIPDYQIIDAAGRIVLPGLIDCHVHVTAVDHDAHRMGFLPPSLITAQSKSILEGMLLRGFTTVRDAAGADFGLREALQRGFFVGPRLFIAGYPLSQTGGHGDMRKPGQGEFICTCAGLGLFGAICDGDGEVRKAVREQLRNGANQIKVMAGGGVSSPTDPIDGTQFSRAELEAIVEEVNAANTYAMAHAYSPRAITRAVEAGIRTIEHGNLMDEASARAMKKAGALYVPTLATYNAFMTDPAMTGFSDEMKAKADRVSTSGVQAIKIARAEGVPIAFGTDLLGKYHPQQSQEFLLRSGAQTPLEILQGATSVAANVLQQVGTLGVVAKGALADVLIVEGDPTVDADVLSNPAHSLKLIMQNGNIVRNSL
jgi:imidazolonepropionase-like amidohydrolase